MPLASLRTFHNICKKTKVIDYIMLLSYLIVETFAFISVWNLSGKSLVITVSLSVRQHCSHTQLSLIVTHHIKDLIDSLRCKKVHTQFIVKLMLK